MTGERDRAENRESEARTKGPEPAEGGGVSLRYGVREEERKGSAPQQKDFARGWCRPASVFDRYPRALCRRSVTGSDARTRLGWVASRADEDESKREDATGHCRCCCSDRGSSSGAFECLTDAADAIVEVARARLRDKRGIRPLVFSPFARRSPKEHRAQRAEPTSSPAAPAAAASDLAAVRHRLTSLLAAALPRPRRRAGAYQGSLQSAQDGAGQDHGRIARHHGRTRARRACPRGARGTGALAASVQCAEAEPL